jgi:DNA-binding MarR family transcriptional regulator
MEQTRKVGLELIKAANKIRRNVHNSDEIRSLDNITGSNGYIIGYIANHSDKEIFQKDIEEKFSLTRSTVSKVLKLMEGKDLIHRESVNYDARLKKLILTEKAWDMHRIFLKRSENLESKITQGFTEDEIQTLFNMLNRINSNLEQ